MSGENGVISFCQHVFRRWYLYHGSTFHLWSLDLMAGNKSQSDLVGHVKVLVGFWPFSFQGKNINILWNRHGNFMLYCRSDEEHALLSPWSSSTMVDRSQHLARHPKQEDQTVLESYEICWFWNWWCESGWWSPSHLDLGWCCQLRKGSQHHYNLHRQCFGWQNWFNYQVLPNRSLSWRALSLGYIIYI